MQLSAYEGFGEVVNWDNDAPIVGLQVEAFNWRLRQARKVKGWTRAELARQSGVNQTVVGQAEKLRRVSAHAREQMSLALSVPEDVLFPGEIDTFLKAEPNTVEFSMTREDIRSVEARDSHAEMLEAAERDSVAAQIRAALAHLPARQAFVIDRRFGLTTGTPMLRDEIGSALGVSGERIQQIEHQAIRRLWRTPEIIDLMPQEMGG